MTYNRFKRFGLFSGSRRLLLLVAIPVLFCGSCKKDKDDSTGEQKLLTGKSWKPAMEDKNPGNNPPGNNLYDAVLDCMKDDTYRFGDNNEPVINRGSEKCSANEESPQTVNYIIDIAGKEITIDGTKYILAELSDTQLKYYAVLPSAVGYNHKIFIFSH